MRSLPQTTSGKSSRPQHRPLATAHWSTPPIIQSHVAAVHRVEHPAVHSSVTHWSSGRTSRNLLVDTIISQSHVAAVQGVVHPRPRHRHPIGQHLHQPITSSTHRNPIGRHLHQPITCSCGAGGCRSTLAPSTPHWSTPPSTNHIQV